ncbi:MAG: hypothetical protein IKN55_06520 [Oscillospiraceae bacterium]|nr:hypothetical protein [Oscillospiraceae bacterium]
MDMKKILKLIGFNFLFVILEVILFRGVIDSASSLLPVLALIMMSGSAFFGVNYMIINKKDKRKMLKMDKLRTIEDYREALYKYHSRNNPFESELREAVYQLDLFQQREDSLRALLGDQFKEPANPFVTVSDEVKDAVLSNIRKFLNRMMIIDYADTARFPMHNEFLHHALGQNRQLLSQYDSLIIEISQIGNSEETQNLHLDSITSALKELRNENATMGEYGAAMMQSRLDD